MDANQNSQIRAAKSLAEQARDKYRLEKVKSVFEDATDVPQMLAYLAGAASVSWTERPKGTFDSDLVHELVDIAFQKIDDRYKTVADNYVAEVLSQAGITWHGPAHDIQPRENGKSALPSHELKLDIEPDEERADSMEREGDHA